MYTQRKSLLDVFPVNGYTLGLFREPFEKVSELAGFELQPVENAPEVWKFQSTRSNLNGRLLDVSGFLYDVPVALTSKGRAYMITRQDFTLALLFPGAPRRIKLNEEKYRVLSSSRKPLYPEGWPDELITRVIRVQWRNIVILNEVYLLRQIGLRGAL